MDFRNTIIVGDAITNLERLPGNSVHTIVTSPPYWGLRSYIDESEAHKIHEIGMEDTLNDYINQMVKLFRALRRVLRDDGTAWLNIGDIYTGSGKGPTGKNGIGDQNKRQGFDTKMTVVEGLETKQLVGLPWKLAFALQADGWWLRSDTIWAKKNALPESVFGWKWEQHRSKSGEVCPGCSKCSPYDGLVLRKGSWRPTRNHEYIFMLSKSSDYFCDGEAVIEGNKEEGTRRNLRDVWHLPTATIKEAHFAVFPPGLVDLCIRASTSKEGACAACGAPIVPILERIDEVNSYKGWKQSCKCKNFEVGKSIVLDPFMGSGTTAVVAQRLDRDFVGCELNPEYAKIAHKRITKDAPLFNECILLEE